MVWSGALLKELKDERLLAEAEARRKLVAKSVGLDNLAKVAPELLLSLSREIRTRFMCVPIIGNLSEIDSSGCCLLMFACVTKTTLTTLSLR